MNRFFFVHVQKTAGTTFREQIEATFTPDEIWPPKGGSLGEYLTAYVDAAPLLELELTERNRRLVVHGHYPFCSVAKCGGDRTSITILRDPVDRVESLLRMNTRTRSSDADRRLEEIYEDPDLHAMQIKDHQAKVFAMTAADGSDSVLHSLDVDGARLEVAKKQLEAVDVLAFQDDLDALTQTMITKFGWAPPRSAAPQNTNAQVTQRADAALRKRIADDNPADQEFWEFACELRASRESRVS